MEIMSVGSSSNSDHVEIEKKYFVGYQRKSIKHSRTHSENTMDDMDDASLVMKNIKIRDYFEDGDQLKFRNSTPKESHNSQHPNIDSTFEGQLSSTGNSMRKTTPLSNSNFMEMEISNKIAKIPVIQEEKESPEFSSKRIRSKTQPASKMKNELVLSDNNYTHEKNLVFPQENPSFIGGSRVSTSIERESQILMIKSKKKKSEHDPVELRESDVFEEVYSESMADSDDDKSDASRRKTPAPDAKPKSSFAKKSINSGGLDLDELENHNYHNVDLKIIVKNILILF
jgi:hypothetical protein